MKKIFTAPTVEEAKAAAAEEFGVEIEKIEFTVLEEPKKGLFGKVKGEAKIEAEYEKLEKKDIAEKYIIDVIKAMGIENVGIEATEEEKGIKFEIISEEFSEMVSVKGELIDSVQYLASLACNKVDREYYRITVDCNGYREKRKEYLENLARKMAEKVKKRGRSAVLDPMNPYERRIIHAEISGIEGVTSNSTGEEPYRKVIISSTERRPRNGGYRGKGGRGRSNRNDSRRPKKHYDITTSFEKDYKRPKPEDNFDAGLYGKIEI